MVLHKKLRLDRKEPVSNFSDTNCKKLLLLDLYITSIDYLTSGCWWGEMKNPTKSNYIWQNVVFQEISGSFRLLSQACGRTQNVPVTSTSAADHTGTFLTVIISLSDIVISFNKGWILSEKISVAFLKKLLLLIVKLI